MMQYFGDLWGFPFVSIVWGNAADWVMVIVTAYTLYYLRRTLRSQLEVQELQQTTTKIENERFRRENEPLYSAQGCDYSFEQLEKEVVVKAKLTFGVFDHDSINLNIFCESIDSRYFKYEAQVYDHSYIQKNEYFYLELEGFIKREIFDKSGAAFNIKFTYEDVVGNLYELKIKYCFRYGEYSNDVESSRRLFKKQLKI